MSDSDTTDSDCGVRYKTTTTRHKHSSSSAAKQDRSSYRDSHSSSRHSNRRQYRRSRSKSPDRRRHRRRSRSAESSSRSRTQHRSARSSRNVSPERAAPCEKLLDISVSSVSSQDDHLEPHQQQRTEKQSRESFGPALPPTLPITDSQHDEQREEQPYETNGPALPQHLLDQKPDLPAELPAASRHIGPTLPPGFVATHVGTNDHATSDSELSPFSEPDEEDQDAEDLIGPLPGTSGSRANVELEHRALEMKIRQIEEAAAAANGTGLTAVPKGREDWMLELPDIRKISDMGLGARQFRTREKQEIGDRTVWTDTPMDRERKKNASIAERSTKSIDPVVERERERERKLTEKRDKEQEKLAKQHKKKIKRDKTLLEMHQNKLKKEKKESIDGLESTRRPFNRDMDLQANRFDEAQKKAVMKKAQLLDTRFSSGSSKYL